MMIIANLANENFVGNLDPTSNVTHDVVWVRYLVLYIGYNSEQYHRLPREDVSQDKMGSLTIVLLKLSLTVRD